MSKIKKPKPKFIFFAQKTEPSWSSDEDKEVKQKKKDFIEHFLKSKLLFKTSEQNENINRQIIESWAKGKSKI